MKMKLMRLAMCVAVFALVGGSVLSEDMDVRALQAKLAAQEARLNDLQAKMYGTGCETQNVAEGLTSLRKNAVVTIGGTLNTRYFSRNGKLDTRLYTRLDTRLDTLDDDGNFVVLSNRRETAKANGSGMRIADAKLEFKIDVNDYFDAYLKLDLQDDDPRAHAAENYWVRWKNICNSGFGILVGRDGIKYGSGMAGAVVDDWNLNYSTGGDIPWGDLTLTDLKLNSAELTDLKLNSAELASFGGGLTPRHTHYDYSRTVQINPYWETQDGSFKAEVSVFSALDTNNADTNVRTYFGDNGVLRSKSMNVGFESYTARLTWKPVEGLTMTGSVMSLYAKHGNGYWGFNEGDNISWISWCEGDEGFETAARNTAVNVGVEYIPGFFEKLRVWAQYSHGWNDFWVKGHDSNEVNAGLEFAFTDQFSVYAQGDYLSTKNDQAMYFYKSSGWAGNIGVKYVLPYGVNFEAGWRHEQVKYKNRAGAAKIDGQSYHTKVKTDTIYAHLGFNF
ncbi:MAG: porin family protein [Planctomycetes bacterium]|nr:porin family protein [Planctomycetota bacterium]